MHAKHRQRPVNQMLDNPSPERLFSSTKEHIGLLLYLYADKRVCTGTALVIQADIKGATTGGRWSPWTFLLTSQFWTALLIGVGLALSSITLQWSGLFQDLHFNYILYTRLNDLKFKNSPKKIWGEVHLSPSPDLSPARSWASPSIRVRPQISGASRPWSGLQLSKRGCALGWSRVSVVSVTLFCCCIIDIWWRYIDGIIGIPGIPVSCVSVLLHVSVVFIVSDWWQWLYQW